jgi:predicted nuclease of predicted toxin-antitoxin system
MRFLADAQLPPALARWIALNGHEAGHVAQALTSTQSD